MVIASFLFSGLGSLLCGKKLGLVFMGIEIMAWICLLIPVVGWILAILFSPLFFMSWVVGMIHAHQSAKAWNRSIGIIA